MRLPVGEKSVAEDKGRRGGGSKKRKENAI